MELSEQDGKDLKRLREFDRSWKKMSMVGKISIAFSIIFVVMGIYVYVTVIPRFSNLSGSAGDDLKVAYSLWCYTFVLLGFCTFITGYLLVSYCRDLHTLFALYDRREAEAAAVQQAGENPPGGKEREDGT